MNVSTLITAGVTAVAALIVGFLIYRRIPKRLKTDKFMAQWKELQGQLRDKKSWPKALTDADKMLDTALKRRKYKGKSMGERMVSAQRALSNNDAVWFAHNLAKKVLTDPDARLKEADVKAALIGFRQALKDIGALQPSVKPSDRQESSNE